MNGTYSEEDEGLGGLFIDLINTCYYSLPEFRDFVFTDDCHKCNLYGSNVDIGIWESTESDGSAVVDYTLDTLNGRIHIIDNDSEISSHATLVATIIGANGDNKMGMAPDVEMFSYDKNNYYSEVISSNVDISTNSYGKTSDLSEYTIDTPTSSEFYDNATRNYNIISFKSAGNHDNEYYTITSPGTAKNIITVGATRDDSINNLASFTSFGPCNDGRLKPEIVAPGCLQYFDYGTSYACPVVSGSSALILEKWKLTHSTEDMLPSTMKALLVHTANNDGNGPTYRYGYGMLDTKEAVDLVELDTVETTTIIQDDSTFQTTKSNNQTIYYEDIPDNIGELKVTLVWSDKEGTNTVTGNDLKNDINLIVSKNDGTSNEYYYPWILDPNNEEDPATSSISSTYDPQSYGDYLNPLEQVQIKNPASGNYSIIIEGDIDYGPQPYSLIITTKPKVEVYSDKNGAKVYVNNEDGFGIADAVIQNGVAEVCTYSGENSIMIEQNSWWSWLFPRDLSIDCTVEESGVQKYYAYFDSYTLELKNGVQVISLPFDVSVSDILPSAGGKVVKFEDAALVTMNSSDILEKGHSYLVKSNEDATIDLDAESNTFEKINLNVGLHFIGAASASCTVSELVGDMDGKIVYMYNETNDDFVQVTSDEIIHPGKALFVSSMSYIEVNV